MAREAFPGAYVPAVNPQTGYFNPPWVIWLAQFAQQPGAPSTITPTGSPFSFTASASGTLQISGGTVSARTLTRGGVTVTVTGSVPVANNDVVTVTYSAAPTISFVPG